MSDILSKINAYSQDPYSELTGNMKWPAMKEDILNRLRQQGAPDFVIQQVEKLPDKRYDNIGELVKEARGS